MMGLFLEELRDHLRGKNNWGEDFCGVQYDSVPPFVSSEWYVAIDDNGMSQTSPDMNNHMREVARIQVGIWKRQGEVPRDQSGGPMLHKDPYRWERETLNTLERDVLQTVVGYPGRWQLVEAINERIEADQDEYGSCILLPLLYTGRGRNETFVPVGHVGGDDIPTYLGRRLNFTGLTRIQEFNENLR